MGHSHGPACGYQPPAPTRVTGRVFAKSEPCFPGRDVRLPGLVGSPSAFPEGLPLLRKPFPARPGGGATRHGLVARVGASNATGGVAQSKKWCLFLQKGADGGRVSRFSPCFPTFSLHPPGCCGAAGGGSRARSHVLPAPPSRACRGRSRHAPAALGRRKQIGFKQIGFQAGVQGAGRPWLVSHRRSVGMGCGERPGRAGMEGLTWQRGPCRQQSPCGKLGTALV